MSRFRYEAARPDGIIVRGTLDAPHGTAATSLLEERHLLPLGVREVAQAVPHALPRRACAVLLRGLGALLEAGIPLDAALRMVRAGPRLGATIDDVRRRVREGERLSAAFAAQPRFPALAVGLVRVGERSGLADACRRAADQLDREADLAYRVHSALAYPVMLVVLGGAAIAVLVIVVLPRFVALLGDLGTALPFTTRVLLAVSGVLASWWLPIVVVGAAAAAVIWWWLRTATGHELLLRVPLLGPTRLQLATARAARALGALLEIGTPALTALQATADAAGDHAVRARTLRAAERVRAGTSLATALEREAALDPQALELATAGDRSGRLPALLLHAADLAESEATRRLDAAVRLLEPSLIVAVGGAVAFVALALLQAVYGVRVS